MWWLWLFAIIGLLAAIGCGALAFMILVSSPDSEDGEEY